MCVRARTLAHSAGRLPGTDIYRDIHRYERIPTAAYDHIRIYRFDAPLMFINVELFRDRLYDDCMHVRNVCTHNLLSIQVAF